MESRALRRPEPIRPQAEPRISRLLPPRSMVGQLPLEQPIGVRIPGGQPKHTSKEFTEVQQNVCLPSLRLFRHSESASQRRRVATPEPREWLGAQESACD